MRPVAGRKALLSHGINITWRINGDRRIGGDMEFRNWQSQISDPKSEISDRGATWA
jgi:hypothetical protein